MPSHTVAQVAGIFTTTPTNVLAWIKNGSLVAINIARRDGSKRPRWRISEEAVQEFAARRQAVPQPRKRQRKREPQIIQFY
jgi:hypothetical protein